MSLGIKRKKTAVAEPKIHFMLEGGKTTEIPSNLVWNYCNLWYHFLLSPIGRLADGFSELQTD